MTLLKNYKGVSIYVSLTGEFYCDPIKNSPVYTDKMFNSIKLASIERAIDNYVGNEVIDGESYYHIEWHIPRITKLKVVKKCGDRLFFDDGRDNSSYGLQTLYPNDIDQTNDFNLLKKLIEEYDDLRLKVAELTKGQQQLMNTLRGIEPKFKATKVVANKYKA